MVNNKIYFWLVTILPLFLLSQSGCKGSQITPSQVSTGGNNGIIVFSGQKWQIKESNSPVGPGGNFFSGSKQNVWVDANGKLHLKISFNKGIWNCAEIYTEKPVGYGKYIFYLSSRVDSLDPNAVLGLFTWNENSSISDANSEIDIEMSRWTDPLAKNLHYSVQPVYGPDVSSSFYSERNFQKYIQLTDNYSTHTFTWTDSIVTFESYNGNKILTQLQIASWSYLNTNPARRTIIDGNLSDPIIIPKPGEETKMHINLWLVSGSDGYGMPPLYNKDIEVIIDKVEFIPSK